MTGGSIFLAKLGGRLALGFAMLVLALSAASAQAETLRVDRQLCYAQSAVSVPDNSVAALRFSCTGTPTDYHDATLWLRTDPARLPIARSDLALMVHQSRFDRLAVAFAYADGVVRWDEVRQGDYGSHWRAGGQIVFEAPERNVPLAGVTMRFDRLASLGLLRARLIPKTDAVVQSTGMAVAVGAALTLLLVSAIYSLSLAVAVRRQYLAWQAGWSAVMLLWGAVWSQAHLGLFPGLAGTVSAQIGTFLACSAIAIATASAVLAVEPGLVSRRLRAAALLLGTLLGLVGVPLALIRSESLPQWADMLALVILADLLAVAAYLGLAWRRGSVEARDFLAAWCLPMAVLAFVHVVDVDDGLWGGGSKIMVLLAATWQALWLSASATRRLALLRVERDRARASEAFAQQLARRDPLTGLLNRRGFVESVTPLLDRAHADDLAAALLVVDIDRFKSINDVHGHDIGDAVLCEVARRIERWEGPMCTVARLGGEEFGLLTVGMEGLVLARFAESVRRGIAACDHRAVIGEGTVTASVGVAEVRPASDFQQLYRLADEALYDAKRAGRDRVVVQRHFTDAAGAAGDSEAAALSN
ncbi:GGDEF domain-containing protein [Sphingopyxis lindanitolerans]|uniref:diguanylate cyclase n=1 Tax=Sphingopyxis lindanitolerans TaxID=2054227 RepID=A0A2S8B8F9_9SPHN|nr:GGDEF domain-containing protein [Sphingopyxis lindanitolerans]PQM28616.1 GGDEF domain-containing protein [Sphingopyxis lindanitolerans]